jgi:hypothetical protein
MRERLMQQFDDLLLKHEVFVFAQHRPGAADAGSDAVFQALVLKIEANDAGQITAVWTPVRRVDADQVLGFVW